MARRGVSDSPTRAMTPKSELQSQVTKSSRPKKNGPPYPGEAKVQSLGRVFATSECREFLSELLTRSAGAKKTAPPV
jgi:hypothetical protein